MHQKTNSPSGVGERLHNQNFNPLFCAFDSPVRTATLTAKWQGNPHQVPISPLGGPELKKMTKTNAGNVSILDWPKKPSGFRDQTNQASAMPAATSVLILTATPSAPGWWSFPTAITTWRLRNACPGFLMQTPKRKTFSMPRRRRRRCLPPSKKGSSTSATCRFRPHPTSSSGRGGCSTGWSRRS